MMSSVRVTRFMQNTRRSSAAVLAGVRMTDCSAILAARNSASNCRDRRVAQQSNQWTEFELTRVSSAPAKRIFLASTCIPARPNRFQIGAVTAEQLHMYCAKSAVIATQPEVNHYSVRVASITYVLAFAFGSSHLLFRMHAALPKMTDRPAICFHPAKTRQREHLLAGTRPPNLSWLADDFRENSSNLHTPAIPLLHLAAVRVFEVQASR